MQRAPYLVAAAVVAAPVALTTHLALEPDPFTAGPAAAFTAGLLLFAIVAASGLLLARGRWALYLSYLILAAQAVVGLFLTSGPWAVAAFVLGAAALAGLSGPWLTGWIRGRATATGPGARPMFLMLGSLAVLPGVAASSPGGFGWQQAVLAGFSLVAAWSYSRARLWGLWLLRVVLAPAALPAILSAPALGAAYLSLHVGGLTGVAWTREALLAISPLLDRFYGARKARPAPSTPEGTE